ncbi:hypothetical protein [Blastomonas sp. SL216]|uniref:hypothetical protein n=1 Tax=Blastomonas sp. SL216 TaxID=2995169 RepID=UPI0023775146|nr:hypothetical protein OU999_00490 [Blastomonas sp. SL216]
MTAARSKLDSFFVWLNRFNAIGIGIALVCLIVVGSAALYSRFQEPPSEYFGDNNHKLGPYAGEEIQTASGPVAAYGIGNLHDGLVSINSPNLSLTHLASGRKRLVLPKDGKKRIIRFETIKSTPDLAKPFARAYVALAVEAADKADGKIELFVGTLPDLDQVSVARDLFAVDLATLYGSDKLAIIIWPKPDQAQLVTIDLGTLRIQDTEAIPLPLPQSAKAADGAGQAVRRATDAAPANHFEF